MTHDLRLPALDPKTVPARGGSSYPAPFREAVAKRSKRALGDVTGLSQFGVNQVELPPGAWSSQRHWHSHEDEFVIVLEGELTLVTDAGAQVLGPGMVAGFPGGRPDGHHLINHTDWPAVYLEVGSRIEQDEAFYPDIDLELRLSPDGEHVFRRKSGKPY